MSSDLESRLLLKTNRYIPEIPSHWLERGGFQAFSGNEINSDEDVHKEERVDERIPCYGDNLPFITANYSGDGEIIAAVDLNGICLLGAHTRTCFSVISNASAAKSAGINDGEMSLCKDAIVFGNDNEFLIGVFDKFVCFWNLSASRDIGCAGSPLPRYIGSVSLKDVTEFGCETPGSRSDKHKHAGHPRDNTILSVQGVRFRYGDEENAVVEIEFVVEFTSSIPLLVGARCTSDADFGSDGDCNRVRMSKVISILPNKLLDHVCFSRDDPNLEKSEGHHLGNRIMSVSVSNGTSSRDRMYSVVLCFRERYYICLFKDNDEIVGFRSIPNCGKRQTRFLRHCRTLFGQRNDLLVVQFPDRFSVYHISEANKQADELENRLRGDNKSEDSECGTRDLGDNVNIVESEDDEFGIQNGDLKYELNLLYTYTQIIQKEWITSISMYSEKSSYLSEGKRLHGPVGRLYPCGMLAVSTISSNGQCFYYIMKICSHSDERSYIGKHLESPCDHHSQDKTGSSMIISKVELTKLNGIRKLVWQPGESVCLAIQFAEKLRNTKIHFDDFTELNNVDERSADSKFPLGNIFFIESNAENDDMLLWSRLITDFTAIHKNREYIERDDEFDAVSPSSSQTFGDADSHSRWDSHETGCIDTDDSRSCDQTNSLSVPPNPRSPSRLHQVINTRDRIKDILRSVACGCEHNESGRCECAGVGVGVGVEWVTKNEDIRKRYVSGFDICKC